MEKFFDIWHNYLLVGVLVVLFGVEIFSLFFVSPFLSAFEGISSDESVLRISEIDGPRIDAVAATTVVTEAALPGELWLFLLLAYVALLVFNFSYTFETVYSPQWFWETLYTFLALFCWYVFDREAVYLWFPFMILKSGLIVFALYVYLLEKRLVIKKSPLGGAGIEGDGESFTRDQPVQKG